MLSPNFISCALEIFKLEKVKGKDLLILPGNTYVACNETGR